MLVIADEGTATAATTDARYAFIDVFLRNLSELNAAIALVYGVVGESHLRE